MISPEVTIIMATYNREYLIMDTLLSIQEQTFKNWECLIIDDGGTDNTFKVITPILENDQRFKYIKRPEDYSKGLPGCRNYGIDLAKSNYIIFFDDDDIVHSDNLKIAVEVIEVKNADFCHYQKKSFEEQKPIIENAQIKIIGSIDKSDIKKVVTQKIGLASCTVLWKKKCFESIRFEESLFYAEEWECYSRIIMENFKGIMISNVLYYNRKHANSNTSEFYRNNPVRKASKQKAILLIVENLQARNLLGNALMRYFVQLSLTYKEFNLFSKILKTSKLNFISQTRWIIVYTLLPFKIYIHKFYKKLIK